jgi:hypothetical protein
MTPRQAESSPRNRAPRTGTHRKGGTSARAGGQRTAPEAACCGSQIEEEENERISAVAQARTETGW